MPRGSEDCDQDLVVQSFHINVRQFLHSKGLLLELREQLLLNADQQSYCAAQCLSALVKQVNASIDEPDPTNLPTEEIHPDQPESQETGDESP